MDEVYLINELRASFLKNSNEVSKTRVIDPYQINVNNSTIHKLYIDNKSGKDYFKIMKSPSINDDYFNVIANEDNISHASSVSNKFLAEFSSPKAHEKLDRLDQNSVLKTPKNLIKPVQEQHVSRRNSLLSIQTNNDQQSNTSKITAKTSRSKLRLSRLSGLFHKHNTSESENKLYYTNSNTQGNKLFKTRSKSASLFSKDFELSSNNSITHPESRRSSDLIRKSMGTLYRKISNNSVQSFGSTGSPRLNNEDKYHSKTTSFLQKGRKLLHFKHNGSSSKTHMGVSGKPSKSELGKNYSTQVLEDMMYTDQLFREGEIPDNFDDSEEEDDDYEMNRSSRSSLSNKKNSLYKRSFSKNSGKKYDDDEFISMLHTDEAEKKMMSNNNSLSQIGSSTKKGFFTAKEGSARNKTAELSSSSMQKNSYDNNEDSIFNFKKISKIILPSNNNNITPENSNDMDTIGEQQSHSDDSLPNADISETHNQDDVAYPKESVEIDSYLEDGQNLDKVLNFDQFHSNSFSSSSKNSLPSVINQPLDKSNNITEETERYYGDLASSFGESLMDDEYEDDDVLGSVENSVPLKNKGFLFSKNDKPSFESIFSYNENHNEYTDFSAENDMVEYFAKKTSFDRGSEQRPSNLTTFLKPTTATKIKFDLDKSSTNYEDIVDDLNGIELTCYLEGNSDPIDLNISMSKNATNFQLLQLILYKFGLQDEIDSYMLRIVDEDGLPFEGTFGILKRDGLVERSLMMEELVACRIEGDAAQIEQNKKQRLEQSNSTAVEEKDSNALVDHNKRVLVIHSNENSFDHHLPAMKIETEDLDTVGEVVSRFCLYNDTDPKKYYLRVTSDFKHYLPGEITLKYFYKHIYNAESKYEIISIKESRQINLRRLKFDVEDNERDESINEDVFNAKEHLIGLTPFTLNNNGNYLPVTAQNLSSQDNLNAKTKKALTEKTPKLTRHKQKKFIEALQKQEDKPYNNGVPLNLNEIYYRYTVFRRQHQKVSLLTNKQLKTLMIDGDFIYLVDCDLNMAPMMTENEFKAENSVYGFGGNNSVWEPQQFLKSKTNNGVNNDNMPSTKTFHVSQIIQIEKSLKSRTHFKIKFIRSHGPKWYYFETLSNSDRDEIITKLTMLKAIYNRNK